MTMNMNRILPSYIPGAGSHISPTLRSLRDATASLPWTVYET